MLFLSEVTMGKKKFSRWILNVSSSVMSVLSYKSLCKIMYYATYKRFPNLKSPTLFSEKLMWYAINKYKNDPLVAKCADKVSVREYVSEKGYSSILNEVYGIWDDANKIKWEDLPDKFVMKCNHASGLNLICKNKSELDCKRWTEVLNQWLKVKYWKQSGELFYKKIKPQIICEKYIETADNAPPKDYKFFCSNGKVVFLYVALDRIDNNTKFVFYTPSWERIPVDDLKHPSCGISVDRPENLEEMTTIAEDLSKEWPQVRVDFYNENNKIIFGEITFLHQGGKPNFSPSSYDKKFGDLFTIDK